MPVIILILALLAIGVSGYLFCRYRAVASAGGNTRTLHSLPGYHGWHGFIMGFLPGVAVLTLWLIAQPFVIEGNMGRFFDPALFDSDAERTLLMADVRRVAEGRESTPKDIDAIAQGRVWTGRQARELGLVDELGGLERAIELAKEHAKFEPEERVNLVVYPPKRSFYDLVSNPLGVGLGASLGLMTPRPELRVIDEIASRLRLFRRGETLTLMPNVFFREP